MVHSEQGAFTLISCKAFKKGAVVAVAGGSLRTKQQWDKKLGHDISHEAHVWSYDISCAQVNTKTLPRGRTYVGPDFVLDQQERSNFTRWVPSGSAQGNRSLLDCLRLPRCLASLLAPLVLLCCLRTHVTACLTERRHVMPYSCAHMAAQVLPGRLLAGRQAQLSGPGAAPGPAADTPPQDARGDGGRRACEGDRERAVHPACLRPACHFLASCLRQVCTAAYPMAMFFMSAPYNCV